MSDAFHLVNAVGFLSFAVLADCVALEAWEARCRLFAVGSWGVSGFYALSALSNAKAYLGVA